MTIKELEEHIASLPVIVHWIFDADAPPWWHWRRVFIGGRLTLDDGTVVRLVDGRARR